VEDNTENRMATARKRGRPTNAEVAARAAPVPVEEVTVQLPPLKGFNCPCCGKGIVPRIIGTKDLARYAICPHSGRQIIMRYNANGVMLSVQLT